MKASCFNLDEFEKEDALHNKRIQRIPTLSYIPNYQSNQNTIDSGHKIQTNINIFSSKNAFSSKHNYNEITEKNISSDCSLNFGYYVSTSDESSNEIFNNEASDENNNNKSKLLDLFVDYIDCNTDDEERLHKKNLPRTISDVSIALDEIITKENVEDDSEKYDSLLTQF